MSTIEERVVSMKFQGDQFLAGIDKSLQKLEQFNSKLKLTEGTKGLDGVTAAVQRQTGPLTAIAEGVQHISDRFKAMGVVGMAALSNVTNQAIFAGQNMIKSLTMEPILQGFREYETNMNSIQTILANTQAAGTKLSDVTAVLDELNHYSDQTIYNFAEMAKNIGTFTAAGVGLKQSASAIKGIANLAALSGSNSEQAAGAMYQLSQAISSGRVSLEDWNSVVNAGMGGTVFQRALAQTAEKMGTLSKGAVKLTGDMKNVTIEGKSFRESITAKPGQESWLTSKVLTQTLAQFTGDLTDAQLAVMGFNKTEIAAIQAQARTAKAAATEVKTMSQLLNTLRESVGSGWAQTWKTIFGDFEGAKKLFTNVNNVLGGFVSASADARNKVLGDWAKLGGRTALINAIGNAFNALVAVIKPVRDAFREIFPPATGEQLANISKTIENFTKNLMIGGTTANNIKRTFAGLFAVVGIGWEIFKQVVATIASLIGVTSKSSGGFLEFTARIGDFLVKVRNAIKNGTELKTIFKAIGTVLAVPIKLLGLLGKALAFLVSKIDFDAVGQKLSSFVSKVEKVANLGDIIIAVWSRVKSKLDDVRKAFAPLAEKLTSFFGGFGAQFKNLFSDLSFDEILSGINTGLFATLVLSITTFIGKLKNGVSGGDGILDKINDSIDELTSTLNAMQNTLRAATLLQIAAALGILTLSVVALSKIDAEGLARATAALAVMFAQLGGALLLFEKASGWTGAAKLPILATGLILLGIAVNVMTSAVKRLAELDWEGLAKGLTGLTVILGVLVGTVQLMPNDKKLISTGIALVVLAAGVKILASAVTDLSGLNWEEMAKGLSGVGALLGALTLFTKFAEANKGGIAQGAGLVLLAVSVKLLASAMSDFTGFSWPEIGRALTAMLGAMTIIAAALYVVPPTAALAAAGVLIVALSLGRIASALEQMGAMSWGEIGKALTTMLGAMTIIAAALYVVPPTAALSAAGVLIVAMSLAKIGEFLQKMSEFSWQDIGKAMTVLAGSMGIIAGALTLMSGAVSGALAMLVVAASLAILAPVLNQFAGMSWGEIAKGLVMLAGVFLVIGAAGLLLAPIVPIIIALGAGITLLGVGILAAGAGVFLFSVGLTALAASGAAATVVMVGMVSALLGLLPLVVQKIGEAIVAFATVIATAAPAITQAITVVLLALITAVVTLIPQIQQAFAKLVLKALETLLSYVPKLVETGLKLLAGFLNGIANNIGRVVSAATNVAVKFVDGVGNQIPKVVQAGVNLILKFVNGIANAIRDNSDAMGRAGANLASAIVEGMIRGLAAGAGSIAAKARSVAREALNAAKEALGINSPSKEFELVGKQSDQGLSNGLEKFAGLVSQSAAGVGNEALSSLRASISNVSDIISGEIDMTPRITPVLDLSDVKKNASQIGSMISVKPISVNATYARANDISIDYLNNRNTATPETKTEEVSTSSGDNFIFNQNNYSPKALSAADIYRQTKNQLSVAKGVMAP